MKANAKVSVIVPVYNVEAYLRRCLDSIAAQTFRDWECILVDDGSSDASGAICDEYAANDSRFTVLHQANGGAAAARNAGLDAAIGEWVLFVDADDWIEPILLETALKLAEENDVDLVQWNMAFFTDIKEMGQGEKRVAGEFNFILQPTYFEPSMWAKVFKKTFAHTVRFPEGVALSEDRLFSLRMYLACAKCFYVEKVLYHYYMRSTSASHSVSEEMIAQEADVVRQMEELCKSFAPALDDFIYKQKRECKNHIILLNKKFDGRLFRSTFPEINKKLLGEKTKAAVVYFLLFFRLDALASFIVFIYKKKTRILQQGEGGGGVQ